MTKRKMTVLLGTAAIISAVSAHDANAQSQQDLQIQINAMKLQLESMQNALAAQNEKAEQAASNAIKVKWEPAPSISSPDGNFEMNLRGRVFVDSASISDDDDNIDVNATELRAARLGIEGKAWKTIKYKIEADFADDEVELKDAYLAWKSAAGFSLTAGQFKTPNSLDEQTSSRHISVMERASFTDAFGLARRIGVGISTGGDNWTAKLGGFQGSNSTDEENEGYDVAGRVTYSPKIDNVQVHTGASFRLREAEDEDNFRYRQRPHQHLSTQRFVDTGSIADADQFYGIELAALAGPAWVAGEYSWLKAEVVDPTKSDPTFSGGYFEVGYFLTGEKRGYKANKGAWDRPKVNNPVYEGGMGAWAVTLRYDMIDLTDSGFFGGEQDTIIAGVNWYLNRHTRLMFNYSRSSIEDAFDVATNGADGENDVDAFGFRAQVDW